jgi:lincosamide and streptogramin A transport system ATP-binding/permease protein
MLITRKDVGSQGIGLCALRGECQNMATIQVKQLSFTYPGSFAPVFSGLDFAMDSSWRLGLVGRNGRGKTTLLKLLSGHLQGRGQVLSSTAFDLFPPEAAEDQSALRALRQAVGPFDVWEKEMARLLALGDEDSLQRWGELEHAYSAADGYIIDALIARESDKMGIDPLTLGRDFNSFSPGERTRLLLAAFFLRKNRFLLIDEPTNHLDLPGRRIAGDFLAGKQGFLLVSHDRAFLDRSVDHIMALQRNSVLIEAGNYSSYRQNKGLRDDFEQEENERLSKDIKRLTISGQEKAAWSDKIEAGKIGSHEADRGYVGARSAAMMKRSLAIRHRIDKHLQEKESLLKDIEFNAPVSLQPLKHPARVLLKAIDLGFAYDDRNLISHLNLQLSQGQRLAITGRNGSGKSTLLKLLGGTLTPTCGSISHPRDLIISVLPQEAGDFIGTPYDLARKLQLPADHFLMLLRKFDFPREAFERDVRGFSLGQQKKLLLAASMARQAHLYLWDEPLNYIDLESREQIEEMLAGTSATLVFIEHDEHFLHRVATDTLAL